MSVVLKPNSMTLPSQALQTLWEASQELGLSDLKTLSIALTQVAVEGSQRNPAFSARIRDIYRELTTSVKTRPLPNKKLPEPPLVPIRKVDGRDPDPSAPPDPYFLYELYGSEQLPRALGRYRAAPLQHAARAVQERNPGTKPVKTTKPQLIDYIVRYVVGE